MRILSFGNVGNFQTGYKDGIVVLTRLRGLLTTSVSQVSYDLQMKTWHNSSTLFFIHLFSRGTGENIKKLERYEKITFIAFNGNLYLLFFLRNKQNIHSRLRGKNTES